ATANPSSPTSSDYEDAGPQPPKNLTMGRRFPNRPVQYKANYGRPLAKKWPAILIQRPAPILYTYCSLFNT
ncbi:MAG: hypothetical protein K2H38_01085, partial [Muribaculaceae bacterium]|nr:hypothetical protein [Muribaculaceae bacterium]